MRRCDVCKKKSKRPLIFDLISRKSDWHFRQHIACDTHQRGLRQLGEEERASNNSSGDLAPAAPDGPCQGFQLPSDGGKLSELLDSFRLYVSYASPSNFRHQYSAHISEQRWEIRRKDCAKSAPAPTRTCAACFSVASDKAIVRNVCRMRTKLFAAQLLRARLFRTEEEVAALLEGMPFIDAYKLAGKKDFTVIAGLKIAPLQKYVRAAFLSMPVSTVSPAMQLFIATTVQPSLKIETCGAEASKDLALQFTAALCAGQFGTVPESKLRLVAKIASGQLDRHPVIQGMIVAAVERCCREDAGKTTMRKANMTDEELGLVCEAGSALACMGVNSALRHFGVAHTARPASLASAHSLGLPHPCLALDDEVCLRMNWELLDGLLPRHEAAEGRRLVVAMDRTYLQRGLNPISMRQGRGLL
ncbi:unnamed protein product [Effrenium voratum]|uniref:Uncharacterized protein n=1 Tax=Effrenium voratum TaxID=2562239 RepID=A0AA36I459_9DINO|nr:unnamed protein product [Effrenium voratum]